MATPTDAGKGVAYVETPEERPPWAALRDELLDRVVADQEALGTPLRKIPVVNHRELDLLVLYVMTMRRGGAKTVTEHLMWSEVYREMKHAPPMTNAAYKIRESYERLLAVYEEELGLPSEYDMAIPSVMPDRDIVPDPSTTVTVPRAPRQRRPENAPSASAADAPGESPTKRPRTDPLASRSCERCNGDLSPPENAIVFCSACDRGFHQSCHAPPIPWQAANIREVDWFCNICAPIQPLVSCELCGQRHSTAFNPQIACHRCSRRRHALCCDPPVRLMAHGGVDPLPLPSHTCALCTGLLEQYRLGLEQLDREALVSMAVQVARTHADPSLDRVYPGNLAAVAANTADDMVLLLLAERTAAGAVGATVEELLTVNKRRFGALALDPAALDRALGNLVASGRLQHDGKLYRL